MRVERRFSLLQVNIQAKRAIPIRALVGFLHNYYVAKSMNSLFSFPIVFKNGSLYLSIASSVILLAGPAMLTAYLATL